MRKNGLLIGSVIILGIMAFSFVKLSEVDSKLATDQVIAIDAGHGGYDPGKVGVSGCLEKDINLMIACKLRQELENKGYQVVMTRTEDVVSCSAIGGYGLEQPLSESRKGEDMRNRVKLINDSHPLLLISIHQNSFSDASVKGCQVFYYKESQQSEGFARAIQEGIAATLQDGNTRREKANTDYYILKNVSCPAVLVECGFLSNPMEEMLLLEEDYQEKIAKGIVKGVISALKLQE